MAYKLLILLAILITGMAKSYSQPINNQQRKLKIALSWGSANYQNYVLRTAPDAEIINMKETTVDSALRLLKECDGILFTGGEDVNPAYFGMLNEADRCKINADRDTLEFELIKEALRLKIPIMGICRGLQILNVALGGTLIIDLPTDYKSDIIHRCEDHLNCNHHVQAVEGSLLSEITQNKNGVVNSNHHQAILQPAPGITISAYSSDGLPEAFEWSNPKDKPLLIAVQWHPERMDANNPYSTRLMQYFISEVVNSTKKR